MPNSFWPVFYLFAGSMLFIDDGGQFAMEQVFEFMIEMFDFHAQFDVACRLAVDNPGVHAAEE